MKKFKGAVFDMDGTLLDSMYIWHNLVREYLRKNNIAVSDDLNEKLTIMGIHKAVDFIISSFHLKMTHEELHSDLVSILADYYRCHAELKPGAANLLEKLHRKNIPMMIFSATPEPLLHLALERLNIKQYFSHGLLSCDSVKCGKNKPQAFFAAAEHLGVPAGDVMIFEDAWYAVKTAESAGFALATMTDKYESHTQEIRLIADFHVEKSWDEFPVDNFF